MRKQQSKPVCQLSLFASALALVTLLSMALLCPPLAQAAGSGPTIIWHQNFSTPGQYHGYPWGTPGENVVVFGQGFPAGQHVKLVLAAGNSNSDPTVCHHGLVSIAQVTTRSDGKFAKGFPWPLTLNKVNQEYSMCSLAKNGMVVSSRNTPGPFVVATANPSEITVWPTTVAAGDTITVTGQNWVLPHEVHVSLVDSQHTTITTITVQSSGMPSGTFRVTFPIPRNTTSGNYHVVAEVDLFVGGVISSPKNLVVTAASK